MEDPNGDYNSPGYGDLINEGWNSQLNDMIGTGNCSGNLTDDKYVWCEMKMFIPCPTGNMPDYDEESGEFPDCPCENN